MKVNESAILEGSEALKLYVNQLIIGQRELSMQMGKLKDELFELIKILAERIENRKVGPSTAQLGSLE